MRKFTENEMFVLAVLSVSSGLFAASGGGPGDKIWEIILNSFFAFAAVAFCFVFIYAAVSTAIKHNGWEDGVPLWGMIVVIIISIAAGHILHGVFNR